MSDLLNTNERQQWLNAWCSAGQSTARAEHQIRHALDDIRGILYVYQVYPQRYASSIGYAKEAIADLEFAHSYVVATKAAWQTFLRSGIPIPGNTQRSQTASGVAP